MKIQRTVLPCLDEETGEIEDTYGFIINLVTKNFPITISGGTCDRVELKRYFLQTCNGLFDRAWNEYENKNSGQIVYQFGEVD